MRNYIPDMYDQWRYYDARQQEDDGYADCPICDESYDLEDEQVCETCRKHGCRQCIQRCTFDGCMEDVCCECADADGYCPYHAEVARQGTARIGRRGQARRGKAGRGLAGMAGRGAARPGEAGG